MAKHFIAVLGTGFYLPCIYCLENQTCDTKFVQEAVLKLACRALGPGDRITICLTEEARRQNWEDRAYSQWEIENQKGTADGTYQGLHSVLKSCLQKSPGVGLETKDIATGKDSHEIARMFSDIYDVLGENEEIYFDITHGLRNIPMLVMTILEYAKVTKDISVGGIYYGAFEVGMTDQETNKRMVPLYDLTFYHTILNWSNAANSFIKYGHADEVKALADENYQMIRSAGNKQRIKELSGNLNNVASWLQKFVSSVETGRGNVTYKNGIRKNYEKYEAQQRLTSEHLVETYYPFKELLEKIDQKMAGFQTAKTNLEIGMATVDWCVENCMIQQGYTALEETLKTFLCEKIGVTQDQEFWREKVVKNLCKNLYEVIEEDYEVLNDRYENWKRQIQTDIGLEKGQELFELIVGTEKHKELVQLMNKVSDKRNDISHFGFTKHTAEAEKLKTHLADMAAEFKEILEQWDMRDTEEA